MLTTLRSRVRDAAGRYAADSDRRLPVLDRAVGGHDLVASHVLAPGTTRLPTGILTAATGAEARHHGHDALQRLEPSHQ